jgi:hypothetical protein
MAIHYTNIKFLEAKMTEHDCIASFERADIGDDVVYRIERTGQRKSLNLFYSDAYEFGPAEYLARPRSIGRGDMILLTPAAKIGGDVTERSQKDGILVGHFREFMGALNWSDVSKYKPKPK